MTELTLGGWLLAGTIGLDLLILLAIVIVRLVGKQRERTREWIRSFFSVAFPSAGVPAVVEALRRDPDCFLRQYMDLTDSIGISEEQQEKVHRAMIQAYQFPRLMRQIRKGRHYARVRAAIWLGYASAEQAVRPLLLALEQERSESVRVHIIHSLVRLGDAAVIPTVVDSLAGSSPEYQERVRGMLTEFGEAFALYFDILNDRRESDVKRLMAYLAAGIGDERGRSYLERLINDDDDDIRSFAARLLVGTYIRSVQTDALLASEDSLVVNLTLEAMGVLQSRATLTTLVGFAGSQETRKSAVVGLSKLVHGAPHLYTELLGLVGKVSGEAEDAILEVISQRVEYLIERVLRSRDDEVSLVLSRLVENGHTSGVLSFLNRNEDPAVESAITSIIRSGVVASPEITLEFAQYGRESLIDRLALARQDVERKRGERVKEGVHPALVVSILATVILGPAIAYVGVRYGVSHLIPELNWFFDYTRVFALFFGGYAFVLNMSYLGLLAFAGISVVKQEAYLRIKPVSMLFRPKMLPSISIVVPAYGEEATIVENVNSLMNLRYPDFEVIVVNDGSTDNTLRVLIDNFELERTDMFVHAYLGTQPVRGIYRNPRIPELIVIDKQNGGKADSLNAGINAARKAYFAAIDSDSLLERDSLLQLAARFLDSEKPVVATGGNIFPINGCRVDRGQLEEIRLPRELLARFQTLEYLRSFMGGRAGWAQLGTLLIISGAFGVFRTRDVVDAHGYLTGSGFYTKDTVAEDMELVVRVSRNLREHGQDFAVQYAYAANCWTEVPSTHKILRNQRDRWQRGLIDTMFFHLKMIFNPKHRAIGLVGFPYYFFFELMGPWIEIQGLAYLIAGLIAGSISLPILAIVLAATIPFGVAVSLSSVLLAEYHQKYFPMIDRLRLIFLSVVENFGYRQYASLLRLRGYISALRRKTGWGTMVRAGFGTSVPAAKESK